MKRYTNEERRAVETALSKEQNVDTYKRLQVLLWRMQGVPEREVVIRSGMRHSTIWRICNNYALYGVNGLGLRYEGGHNRKLSFEEEASALKECNETAEKGGFVRIKELQAEFEKLTGVHYHLHVFYRLLERHGWRKVKPRGQHPKKADDEAIEASKKLT